MKGKKRTFSDVESDDESEAEPDMDSDGALEEVTGNKQDRHTNTDKFIGVVITTRPPKGWYACGRSR